MTTSLPDSILVDRQGAVATITINRPEKLNAINTVTARGLSDACDMLSANDDVRVVVLRGAGDRAFGVGADISEFKDRRDDPTQAQDYEEAWGTGLANCRHPVIALIKGYCIGGSMGLLPETDLRIAGESSTFAIPAGRLGITYGHDDIAKLKRLVSHAHALEILLEASQFPASRALEIGLVSRVVPDDQVENEVYATAERIAANAPLSARWHKKFARRLLDPAPLNDQELAEPYLCFGTEDYDIGRTAFANRTKPDFKGR
ncbi:MAG: enoyl-CoA hydratase [Rhodospirillaceae bacterium]|nr:enoyl-CoA hydratase [Rhodospirillaceae bacterium]|tara:strand:- start:7216 stop:7998 length:783 start_codon:yes stop_codon:yes gene_type:complete